MAIIVSETSRSMISRFLRVALHSKTTQEIQKKFIALSTPHNPHDYQIQCLNGILTTNAGISLLRILMQIWESIFENSGLT